MRTLEKHEIEMTSGGNIAVLGAVFVFVWTQADSIGKFAEGFIQGVEDAKKQG